MTEPKVPDTPAAEPKPSPLPAEAIDYDRWVQAIRPEARAAQLQAATRRTLRAVRRRPRHPEEVAVLTELVKARWRRALATGDVEELGPRRFRIRV